MLIEVISSILIVLGGLVGLVVFLALLAASGLGCWLVWIFLSGRY